MKQLDLISLLQRAVEEAPDTITGDEDEHDLHVWRSECPEPDAHGIRACPFVSCRHHLAIEVRVHNRVTTIWEHPFLMRDGELQMNTGAPMCSLDVGDLADLNDMALSWVLGLSRERARQIIDDALRAMRQALGEDDGAPLPSRDRAGGLRHAGELPGWLQAAKDLHEKAREEGRTWTRGVRTGTPAPKKRRRR